MEINSEGYNNADVMAIRAALGKFKFGTPHPDNIKRVKKPLLMLENGAKYEGEWIEGTEVRDGRGI
jgi:hypothetical protein